MEKPSITIPRSNNDEVVIIPPGPEGVSGDWIKKKFSDIDRIFYAILLTVALSLVAIIVSVVGLFVDQMRYNNAAYRDYSEKMQSVDDSKKIITKNESQAIEGQRIIIEQQKQIIQLIKLLK